MDHLKEKVVFLQGHLKQISTQRKEKCDGRKCLIDGATPSNSSSLLFSIVPLLPPPQKKS